MAVFDEAWVACILRGDSTFSQIRARSFRAGVHSGDAGRVVDPPRESEVREHVPEKPRE